MAMTESEAPSAIKNIQRDLNATAKQTNAHLALERTTLDDLHPFLVEMPDDLALTGTPYAVVVNESAVGVVFLTDDEESPGLIVSLADQVQDYITDELRRAWPECPGHSHPMKAATLKSVAVWICPETNERISLIGHLSEVRAQPQP
jgi:hypothetical protein